MVRKAQAAYAPQAATATRLVARDGEARLMFDASALTKRYASEAGRDRVLMLFEAASELLVAAHCKTEVASALLRRRRDGSLPAPEFDRAWAAAQRDVADMAFFPLFVDPAQHQGLKTFAVMAATIAALTFLYGLCSVMITYHLAERIRANPKITAVLNKLAGVFLIGFGLKLAVSK